MKYKITYTEDRVVNNIEVECDCLSVSGGVLLCEENGDTVAAFSEWASAVTIKGEEND